MSENLTHPGLIRAGRRVLSALEAVGLVVIAVATVVAAGQEILEMIAVRKVTLGDLLLLFIYLEVLTMVAVYLESGALPVRMPLYIAMVALARHLILDMKEITETEIIATSAAVLILAAAVLVIRFGHLRFPYDPPVREARRQDQKDT
jgi:protein PsiE